MAIVSSSLFSRRMLFGASLAVFALTSAAKAADQITFVSQGGAYQKAQTVAILDPAAKKLGITINQDSAPDAWPVIKTQVASGKPTWDVVDTPTGYCLRGGEQGLIEKLDFSKLPNGCDARGISQRLFGGLRILFERPCLQRKEIRRHRRTEQLG